MSSSRIALVVALTVVGCGAPPAQPAFSPGDVPAAPPIIQNGDAFLQCTISAKENGTQKLTMQRGNGLEMDVVVSPIVDGSVNTRGPDKGGAYRFTSHLAQPGKGTLAGVGAVTIDDLDTKVNVEMNRYNQPGGPGTKLTFDSADMASRGIYIEFAGHAHADNGDKYAFRITLGQPTQGSGGAVMPDGPSQSAPIMSKMVMVQAPVTTVITTATTTTTTKLR
jgi:hypothetical protein